LSFLIRSAIESDAAAVSKLIEGLSGYFATASISQISQSFRDTISVEAVAERIASSDFCCFVAEDHKGLSGFVAFRNPSHLFHLFVAQPAQSRGLGKLLWQKVLDQSTCAEITVNSSIFAIPFYQRLGFVRAGPDQSVDGISYAPMTFMNSG
jgi:GNAT superfamily N-acetyltransferase